MVPVMVEGPWDNLSYRPDLGAMVKEGVGKAVEGALSGKLPSVGGFPTKLFGR
jgi:AsmA protein